MASPTLPLAVMSLFSTMWLLWKKGIIGNACAIQGPHEGLLSKEVTKTCQGTQVPGIDAAPSLNTEEAKATEDKKEKQVLNISHYNSALKLCIIDSYY